MFLRHLALLAVLTLATAFAAAADRPLTFDPALSRVDVVVKATVDSFTGRLSAYNVAATIDEKGAITGARLDFRFLDVLTGKPKRDKAMHEWQDTARFPDASFVLDALRPAEGGDAVAEGRLTFHGTTRPLSFPVKVSRDGAAYGIDGDAAIDTREFGLPVIRMMGVLKVDPIVHVKFHFQGKAS